MNLKKLRQLQEEIEKQKREKDRASGVKDRILKENNVTSIEQLESRLRKKEAKHKELQEELDKEERRFYSKWKDQLGDDE